MTLNAIENRFAPVRSLAGPDPERAELSRALLERSLLCSILHARRPEGMTDLRIFHIPAVSWQAWVRRYGPALRRLDLTVLPVYRAADRQFEIHVSGRTEEIDRLDEEYAPETAGAPDPVLTGPNPMVGFNC